MDGMRILYFLPYGLAGFFTLIGLPLALRLIGPNRFYGVRTQRTMENLDVWYAANTANGIAMVAFGILSAIIVFFLHKYWGTDTDIKLLVAMAVPVVLVLFSVGVGLQYA